MKPEELMIGDLVLYKDEPIMVWEIDEYYNRINTEPDGYNSIRCIEISDIKPIPLTPEILEKNGFVKDKYGEMILELDDALATTEIVLVPSYDEMYYWWKVNNELITKIKSIHELQHVLRLCGINKDIFKNQVP